MRRGNPQSTPTENRTRIKGLGNLRSIHLTMGAHISDCKVTRIKP
jgi:hypothetical protein